MEIFLIRHTTPQVEKGTCYGQSDLETADSFHREAALIKTFIPSTVDTVYSSPLKRCSRLAKELFPAQTISYHHELKEIHCGEWEMQKWDEIPPEPLQTWMADFVHVPMPGGESYLDLFTRTTGFLKTIISAGQNAAVITHGGVIRSLLSHITSTPLLQSFDKFSIEYGCVIKLGLQNGLFYPTILYNNKNTAG
jgi:alpha-ribazole phosphatase